MNIFQVIFAFVFCFEIFEFCLGMRVKKKNEGPKIIYSTPPQMTETRHKIQNGTRRYGTNSILVFRFRSTEPYDGSSLLARPNKEELTKSRSSGTLYYLM